VLAPRRGGAPGPDGFVEFDLLARPPAEGFAMPRGGEAVRRIEAVRLIPADELGSARGVRVFAARNASQIAF
jgi:hypothetical protein